MANLCAGDVILAIEGVPTKDMLHCDAQNKIKESTHKLSLTIERSNSHGPVEPVVIVAALTCRAGGSNLQRSS